MPVTDAYNAPVKDMKFVLHELWDASELSTYEGYEDASPEVIDAMLEEAAKFMKNELLPLNQTGDREGCTLENGVVRTPTGFKAAFDQVRPSYTLDAGVDRPRRLTGNRSRRRTACAGGGSWCCWCCWCWCCWFC